jgi:hypothetical protein
MSWKFPVIGILQSHKNTLHSTSGRRKTCVNSQIGIRYKSGIPRDIILVCSIVTATPVRAKCPADLILLDLIIPLSKLLFIYLGHDQRRDVFKNTQWRAMSGYTCEEIKPFASPNYRINIFQLHVSMTKRRRVQGTSRPFGYFTALHELRILCTTNDIVIMMITIMNVERCGRKMPWPIWGEKGRKKGY